MASEEFRIELDPVSDQPSEEGEWLSKAQAAVALSVSERTIESRLQSGILKGRMKEGRREVFLRKSKNRSEELLKEDPKPSDKRELFSEPPSESDPKSFGIVAEALRKMTELSERILEQSSEIQKIASERNKMEIQLEKKTTELQIMNNEREGYNTKLTRYRDQEAEIERLRRENEELRRKVVEQEPEKPKKGFRFLGLRWVRED